MFEAQSISKAVAATATLVLVNSGRLSLDESPNAYLTSWKLPYNEYQAHEKVTLRKRASISAKFLAYMLVVPLAVTGFAKPQTGREPSQETKIERVLSGLRPPIAIKGQPPVRWTLAERMADGHVPGLSVAVIDDGKIAWARGFGVREAGTHFEWRHHSGASGC